MNQNSRGLLKLIEDQIDKRLVYKLGKDMANVTNMEYQCC